MEKGEYEGQSAYLQTHATGTTPMRRGEEGLDMKVEASHASSFQEDSKRPKVFAQKKTG